MRNRTLPLLAVALLGACQTLAPAARAPSGSPDAPESPAAVSGDYRGYLWVEGDPLVASLALSGPASRLAARLHSEGGVSGTGSGRVSGGSVSLVIPYGTSCPGNLELVGTVSADGIRFLGEFMARDCTGASTGRFEFRR